MNVKLLLYIFLILCSFIPVTQGQKRYYNQHPLFLKANSVWCFGEYAGLNFNSGRPVSFRSNATWFGMTQYNSTSSVADPVTGRLLFYTNGKQFFKGPGQLMLNGSLADTSWTTTIVPVFNEPGRYYVFSLNTPDSLNIRQNFWPTGLFYSIVDMSMDNGRGDVDPAYQNVLLDGARPSASMIAVLGNQCDDIWLLVYYGSENSVRAYHITPKGIDPNPVISPLPMQMHPSKMAISPDRKKMAVITHGALQDNAMNRLYLSDFDASTGKISNTIAIRLDSAGRHRAGSSVCFSPDNSKLYAQISYQQSGTNAYAGIYQYNVSIHDSTRIAQSMTFIAETGLVTGYFKLYNDTIYVAGGLPGFNAGSYLSRIERPDSPGTACQYNNRAISLAAGSSLSWQPFNNEVVIPFKGDSSFYHLHSTICSDGDASIQIQSRQIEPGYNYRWNTGDTTKSITVDQSGIYTVTYNTGLCQIRSETYEITLSNIGTAITVNGFQLSTTGGPFTSYQWLREGVIIPGATKSTHTVTENGAYQVIVSNADGCTDTSATYVVSNVGIKHMTADEISIYPNPAQNTVYIDAPLSVTVTVLNIEGRLVARQQNTRSVAIGNFSEGIYLLKITDKEDRLLKMEKIIHLKQ